MINIKKILFCTFIATCSYASQPFYQFNFDKLEAAHEQIAKRESSYPFLASDFARAVNDAKRQLPAEKQDVEFAKEFARTFRTTGELALWNMKTVEDVINSLITYFGNETIFPDGIVANTQIEKFLTDLPERIKTCKDEQDKLRGTFQEYVEQMGPWRQWKFVNIIHNILLTPSAQGNEFIRALKQTGFLQCEIDFTVDFSYDPSIAISYYLCENEAVDSLVLGCGHHLATDITNKISVVQEAGCGMCDITNCHKGELTIALSADTNADIIGDMHDRRIWEVLSSKGWKKISDHSWSESLRNDATLESIYATLAPGGTFEIWDNWTNANENGKTDLTMKLEKFGFKFKSIDDERKTINFTK